MDSLRAVPLEHLQQMIRIHQAYKTTATAQTGLASWLDMIHQVFGVDFNTNPTNMNKPVEMIAECWASDRFPVGDEEHTTLSEQDRDILLVLIIDRVWRRVTENPAYIERLVQVILNDVWHYATPAVAMEFVTKAMEPYAWRSLSRDINNHCEYIHGKRPLKDISLSMGNSVRELIFADPKPLHCTRLHYINEVVTKSWI